MKGQPGAKAGPGKKKPVKLTIQQLAAQLQGQELPGNSWVPRGPSAVPPANLNWAQDAAKQAAGSGAFVAGGGRGGISGEAAVRADTAEGRARKAEREARFAGGSGASQGGAQKRTLRAARESAGDAAEGTSAALEKPYLRLTALPTLDAVRPPHVLAVALERVKERWKEGGPYAYVCEQLKSIRQDLTVQHSRSPLAVEVYRSHARIALQAGDLAEFNQCQTALRDLCPELDVGDEEAMEFAAYGLLYALLTDPKTLGLELGALSPACLRHPSVAFALHVCAAVRGLNGPIFLEQLAHAPALSLCLLERLKVNLRGGCLRLLCAAFRPSVPTSLAQQYLACQSLAQAREYLQAEVGPPAFSWQADTLDTRAARV